MKLLHVCPTLNPSAGGTVTAILSLVSEEPSQQEIATLDHPDSPWLATIPTRCHAFLSSGGKYSYSPELVPRLRKMAGNYEAVVIHGIWQYHSVATQEALENTGIPYVIFPHGMLDPWFRWAYPLKHLKKLGYWHWREKLVFRRAACVIYTSQEEQLGAHQSFRFSAPREAIIPLGIIDPLASSRQAVEPRQKELLFLGRLDRKKACDLLLQAFARVLAGTSWRLIMAGPDSSGWLSDLQRMAQELGIESQVEWPGMLLGEKKWQAIRQAGALVLPSHQENFGLVVVEALACGTPVLLSRKVNIWREVVAAQAGLAEEDSLAGLEKLLQSWVRSDLTIKTEMGRAARECFTNNYDIRQVVRNLVNLVKTSTTDVNSLRERTYQ